MSRHGFSVEKKATKLNQALFSEKFIDDRSAMKLSLKETYKDFEKRASNTTKP